MKNASFILLLLISTYSFGQEEATTKKLGGTIELGARNTISTFSSTGNMGIGFGGQFRIRLGNRLNTEWFADILTENVDNLARRNDDHMVGL